MRTGIAATLLVAGIAVAPAATADDERISRYLAEYQTLEAMTGWVGRKADSCVWASRRTELCSWILAKADKAAWLKLARLIHTQGQIGLICEFDVDGPGEDNWCFARSRRTNRKRWTAPTKRGREAVVPLARAALAAAETLPDVSRLMGVGPDECRAGAWGDESICVWRADNKVYGHAVLAASLGAETRKKVRLECVFPNDGGRRAEGSCVVSVGY